jgi:hypothetical protein
MHTPSVQRTIDREIMLSPPSSGHRTVSATLPRNDWPV